MPVRPDDCGRGFGDGGADYGQLNRELVVPGKKLGQVRGWDDVRVEVQSGPIPAPAGHPVFEGGDAVALVVWAGNGEGEHGCAA